MNKNGSVLSQPRVLDARGQASCERGMWIDELVTSSPLAEPAAAESAIDVTLTPCHALQAAWTVRL